MKIGHEASIEDSIRRMLKDPVDRQGGRRRRISKRKCAGPSKRSNGDVNELRDEHSSERGRDVLDDILNTQLCN